MDFRLDKPIAKSEDDLLERSNFAKKIADAILTLCVQNEPAVLGIQGVWGSGKTSLINLIETCLNSNKIEKHIEVIKLDSWLTTDKEELFNEFFTCIVEGIQRDGELDSTGEEIISYANKFIRKIARATTVDLGVPGNSINVDFGKIIDEAEPESIRHKKEIINEKLNNDAVPYFVFFIDDIDRLSFDEIAMLFQLIKNIADFKKIIYVLSYDPLVVGEALNKLHQDRGAKYIEKVVQIPVKVPCLTDDAISEYFYGLLKDVLGNFPEELIDKEHMELIFYDGVRGYLKTIRDCNRLINTIKIKYDVIGDSIDIGDLLGLTTLELFEPQIFDVVYDKKDIFLGTTANGILEVPKDQIKTSWNVIENKIKINSLEHLRTLLALMFPRFGKAIEFSRTTFYIEESKVTPKIKNAEGFDSYFTLQAKRSVVTQTEALAWLECGDKDLYVKVLESWQQNKTLYNALRAARQVVKNDSAHSVTQTDNFIRLLRALSSINFSTDTNGMFLSSEYTLAKWLCGDILIRIDNKGELVKKVFSDNEISLSILCNLLIDMSAGYDWYYGSDTLKNSPTILSEVQFDNAVKLFLGRVKIEQNKDEFLNENEIYFILTIWKHCESKSYKDFMVSHMSNFDLAKFACIFVNDGLVHSSDKGTYRLWRLNYKEWFEEIDFEVTFQAVDSLIKNNRLASFDDKNQMKLRAFVDLAKIHKNNLAKGLLNRRVEVKFDKEKNEFFEDDLF